MLRCVCVLIYLCHGNKQKFYTFFFSLLQKLTRAVSFHSSEFEKNFHFIKKQTQETFQKINERNGEEVSCCFHKYIEENLIVIKMIFIIIIFSSTLAHSSFTQRVSLFNSHLQQFTHPPRKFSIHSSLKSRFNYPFFALLHWFFFFVLFSFSRFSFESPQVKKD